MKYYRLLNCENGTTIGFVTRAVNPFDRTIGLLRSRIVPAGRGMWFDDCSAVHTLFMGCEIDVVFLNRDLRIVQIVRGVRPNRILVAPNAHVTVELGAGTAEHTKLRFGDRIDLVEEDAA